MDKPKVVWIPANTKTWRKADRKPDSINTIVIHTMEGTYAGTNSWFRDRASAASHYGISRQGEIAQYVDDADIAFHAGNWPYNAKSIGIELEAALNPYSMKMYKFPPNDFPTPMLGALVQLTRWLCQQYPILPDRRHIVGHNEVPNEKVAGKFGGIDGHTDPGQCFKWDEYLASIQ